MRWIKFHNYYVPEKNIDCLVKADKPNGVFNIEICLKSRRRLFFVFDNKTERDESFNDFYQILMDL